MLAGYSFEINDHGLWEVLNLDCALKPTAIAGNRSRAERGIAARLFALIHHRHVGAIVMHSDLHIPQHFVEIHE